MSNLSIYQDSSGNINTQLLVQDVLSTCSSHALIKMRLSSYIKAGGGDLNALILKLIDKGLQRLDLGDIAGGMKIFDTLFKYGFNTPIKRKEVRSMSASLKISGKEFQNKLKLIDSMRVDR